MVHSRAPISTKRGMSRNGRMRQHLTATASDETAMQPAATRSFAVRMIAAAAFGALLAALLGQIPVTHQVDIGGSDAAYVRGFYDPERSDAPGAPTYLNGSDGSARWSRAESYLLFPQAGLPAEVTIRVRGWRAGASPPAVTLLVEGGETRTIATTGEWQDLQVPVSGGLLKPEDVLIILRTEVAPAGNGDPRRVGVLIDRATYRTAAPPLMPYPAQLAWGALAGALLCLALTAYRTTTAQAPDAPRQREHALLIPPPLFACLAGAGLVGMLYLLLYRFQPPYPYPLRGFLPAVCVTLGVAAAVRHGPRLATRLPVLPDVLAPGGIVVWTGMVLLAAREHVTLSVPGVEKDFRVFATRAVDPALIFRADGFYNLGYPLLLWCVAPLTGGNLFLAATLIAAMSGALLLGATWVLVRQVLGRWPATVALIALGFSPFVVQYALYVGSDMPFAALCILALTLLLVSDSRRPWPYLLAGLAAGAAFLVRHPGILLLPSGVLALLAQHATAGRARSSLNALVFCSAFFIAILPQLFVNLRDTGNPIYSQQAKNVWLAVYGDGDWGRWNEVSNDVSLARLIADDPPRFVTAWWTNLRGFIGAGAEDTSESGRAMQLRLLAFPANWLAVLGIAGWLALILVRGVRASLPPLARAPLIILLTWVALYAGALSVGLPLQRFFLPLAPVYAIAAAWALTTAVRLLAAGHARQPARLQILAVLALLFLMWDGVTIGARYVLDRQPAAEVAAVRLVQQALPPGERFGASLAPGDPVGKYSAIAHRVASAGEPARYLLHSTDAGSPPAGAVIATSGTYVLLQVGP